MARRIVAEAEYYHNCKCTWLDWHTCGTVKNTELEEPAKHEVEDKTIPIPVLSENIT